MNRHRLAVYAGVLATAIATAVAGLAARADQTPAGTETRPADRDRRTERRSDTAPGDRRVMRLEGRGSQLGVTVSDLAGQAGNGVRIDDVAPDSAADQAGAKRGDVVVEFDGERVRSARQLTRLVQETPPGRAVAMVVRRGDDRQTLDVTPEARESFVWNGRLGADLEREIERGVEQGLRDLPDRIEPFLNFRMDGLPAMMSGGRGRLGVSATPLSDQLAEHFGVTGGGVLVSSVSADSPAARAGVKAGDVITRVNGAAVKDPGDLAAAVNDVADDGAVTLDIVRDRQTASLKATIDPRRPSRAGRGHPPA